MNATKQPIPAGYAVVGTGGNCDAFQRDIMRGCTRVGYVLITEQGDPVTPAYTDTPVTLGIYNLNDDSVAQFDCDCTADAVAIAAKITAIEGQTTL